MFPCRRKQLDRSHPVHQSDIYLSLPLRTPVSNPINHLKYNIPARSFLNTWTSLFETYMTSHFPDLSKSKDFDQTQLPPASHTLVQWIRPVCSSDMVATAPLKSSLFRKWTNLALTVTGPAMAVTKSSNVPSNFYSISSVTTNAVCFPRSRSAIRLRSFLWDQSMPSLLPWIMKGMGTTSRLTCYNGRYVLGVVSFFIMIWFCRILVRHCDRLCSPRSYTDSCALEQNNEELAAKDIRRPNNESPDSQPADDESRDTDPGSTQLGNGELEVNVHGFPMKAPNTLTKNEKRAYLDCMNRKCTIQPCSSKFSRLPIPALLTTRSLINTFEYKQVSIRWTP